MSFSVIDELVTLLGLDLKPDTMQKVRKFETGIDSIAKYAIAATAAISATAASIGYFTERAVESASNLDKFAQLTGQSAQSLQKWSYAAEQAGGNAAAVSNDIMGLVKAMNPVMPGEFNQGLFMLGMYGQKYKDIDSLLLGLSEKFKGMSAGKALNWASHIGISQDTVLLLRKGKEGIEQLRQQTPFLMSDEDLKRAREFEAQVNRVKFSFGKIRDILFVGITPTISKVIDLAEQWLTTNHEIVATKLEAFLEGVAHGFGRVAGGLEQVTTWLGEASPSLGQFLDVLTDAGTIGNVTAIIFAGIALVLGILVAKWVAIAGVITVAALAVDDFCTYLEGGASLTGEFLGYVKELATEFSTKFPNIAKLIGTVYNSLKLLARLSLDGIIYMVKDLWAALTGIASVFATTLNGLAWFLNLLLTPFAAAFNGNPDVGNPEQGPKKLSPTEKGILSGKLFEALTTLQKNAPAAPTMNAPANTQTQVSSTHETNNTFYVTSTDPEGAAREIDYRLSRSNPPDMRVRSNTPRAQ